MSLYIERLAVLSTLCIEVKYIFSTDAINVFAIHLTNNTNIYNS